MASRKPIVVSAAPTTRKPFSSGIVGGASPTPVSSAAGASASTSLSATRLSVSQSTSPVGVGGASPGRASPAGSQTPTGSATPNGSSSAVKEVSRQMSNLDIAQSRRRLSIMGTDQASLQTSLDGDRKYDTTDHADIIRQAVENAELQAAAAAAAAAQAERKEQIIKEYFSLSKVGYAPYNPSKVNQDRACEVVPFGKSRDKAFFGVFDGHGQHGHLVSEFVARNLPKFLMRQKELDTSPPSALSAAFLNCNGDLATQPRIDCAFSGSTGVAVYITGNTIYCANAGDSRAVIGRREGSGHLAIPLSTDHKPDRSDEYERIIAAGGRVEACRGVDGSEVGPARVWLRGQDVPGLAMTRSFGDLVAASVGVIARPEVEEYRYHENDAMLIMGSDGIWEFITSQEAVDIAAAHSTPEAAAQALLREAEAHWREEEEVIDDITVLVAFF